MIFRSLLIRFADEEEKLIVEKKPAPSKSFMINTENTCVSYTAINYKDS